MSTDVRENGLAGGPDEAKLPDVLPLIAVKDTVHFPGGIFSLWVGWRQSLGALEAAWGQQRCLVLVAQREAKVEDPAPDDLHDLGVVARVTAREDLPSGTVRISGDCLSRVHVREYLQTGPFHRVRVELLPEEDDRVEAGALAADLIAEFRRIAASVPGISPETVEAVASSEKAGRLVALMTPHLSLPVEAQQEVLETHAAGERLEKLARWLRDEEYWRASLVKRLGEQGNLPTAACRRAFTRVPRHRFVPAAPLAAAYNPSIAIATFRRDEGDREVWLSSISAPDIVAKNIAQLRLRRGLKVLEIGAGSGYNAALLAEMVGAENVVSIDLDQEIVDRAREQLQANGYGDVFLDVGDGWDGYPARAPYDRIIGTVGVDDLPPAWWEQLREGGLLVTWLSFRCLQFNISFRKRGGRFISEEISPIWSIDMRGKQPRRVHHHLGDRLTVTHDSLDEAALARVDEILDGPGEPVPLPEGASSELAWGFHYFLALAHPLSMQVTAARLQAHGVSNQAYAIADLERGRMAVAGSHEGRLAGCICFGGTEIGEEMRGLVARWVDLGHPTLDRLVLAAYPRTIHPRPVSSRGWMGVIEKGHVWYQWRCRPKRA